METKVRNLLIFGGLFVIIGFMLIPLFVFGSQWIIGLFMPKTYYYGYLTPFIVGSYVAFIVAVIAAFFLARYLLDKIIKHMQNS